MKNLHPFQNKKTSSPSVLDDKFPDRNRNISAIISTIQDDGPATTKKKKIELRSNPVVKKKLKLVENPIKDPVEKPKTEHLSQVNNEAIAEALLNAQTRAKSNKNENKLFPAIFISALVISAIVFYFSYLNTRIDALEQSLDTQAEAETSLFL